MAIDENQAMEDDFESEARQQEWAARYPYPLPSHGDAIFVKDQDPERKFLHGLGPPYSDSYRLAADILLQHVKKARAEAKRTTDELAPMDLAHWLVYPIYFSFRQSVELSLKSLLRVLDPERPLTADEESLISKSHVLLDLWKPIKPWADGKLQGLREATESFEELLGQIQREDEQGDAARYATRWVGTRKNRKLQPSFESCAPLSLEAVEDAGVRMLNYIQRIFTAIEDEERAKAERSNYEED